MIDLELGDSQWNLNVYLQSDGVDLHMQEQDVAAAITLSLADARRLADFLSKHLKEDADDAGEDADAGDLLRWQNAIREMVIRRSGAEPYQIDGSGTDSGDPLDLTLAEISAGFNYLEDQNE